MELPDLIALANSPPTLEFLVIGGFAVAAHGHARSTFDVDFLVRQPDCERWRSKAQSSGMQVHSETNAFIQFYSSGGLPLDLMLVNDATFEKFLTNAEKKNFGSAQALVPSLDDLLALKLHVLKQGLAHRTSKDAEDVEMLVRRNKLDLNQEHYRELFLKYGTDEIYQTVLRVLRH